MAKGLELEGRGDALFWMGDGDGDLELGGWVGGGGAERSGRWAWRLGKKPGEGRTTEGVESETFWRLEGQGGDWKLSAAPREWSASLRGAARHSAARHSAAVIRLGSTPLSPPPHP